MKILYEDNHLIGVVKPFNILTQKDKTGDKDLVEEIKNYLKKKYNKPGNVFLGMVHRLDRPAGGVMVFARTSKAAGRLSKQWREGTVRKLYLAWVEGTIENQEFRKETSYLSKNEKTNRVAVYSNPAKGARKSELLYRAIKKKGENTLIEVDLLTGRPHQIRAQMAFIGHPVLGDVKYGARNPLKNKNIALFSHYLAFEHPVAKEEVILAAEPDPGWEI